MSNNFDYGNCTMEEFWMYVASQLKKSGYDTIMVGGGVATLYSDGAYMSGDIDLVMGSIMYEYKDIHKVMFDMGFKKDHRFFSKPGCKFTVDISSYPVTINGQYISEDDFRKVSYGGESLAILTPTDCIIDRLNKAQHYADETAFNAAVEVAKRNPFDTKRVEKFFKKYGMNEIKDRFFSELKKVSKK